MNDIQKVFHEHPFVAPQLSHLRHMPLRTILNCLHSWQGSPSYPFCRASCTSVMVTVSRCISTFLATRPCSPFFPLPFSEDRREGKTSELMEVELKERGSTKSSPSSSSVSVCFFSASTRRSSGATCSKSCLPR